VKKSQKVEEIVVEIILRKKKSNCGKVVGLVGIDDVVDECLFSHAVSPYLMKSI
jgi:hypothetical protein